MNIACPNCQRLIHVDKQSANTSILCPHCNERFTASRSSDSMPIEVVRLRVPFLDVAVLALQFFAVNLLIGAAVGLVVWFVRYF